MKKLGKSGSPPPQPARSGLPELLGRSHQLLQQHQYAQALPLLELAQKIAPHDKDILTRLGVCYLHLGQPTQAETFFRKVLQHNHLSASTWHNLGMSLAGQQQWPEALRCGQKALSLAPQNIQFLTQLAEYYRQTGERQEVKQLLEKALTLEPGHLGVVHNLALLLEEMEDLDHALPYWQRAYHEGDAKIRASAAMSIGVIYSRLGRIDLSWSYWYEAYNADPHDPEKLSNLLFYLYASPTATYEEIWAMHRRYGEVFTDPFLPQPLVFANTLEPERRLRVGYVSADLRSHSVIAVSGFIWLLENHPGSDIEVFAYANNPIADDVGAAIHRRIGVDHWRHIFGMPDDAVVAMIKQDKIDILVDLSGHTLGRRLQVFANKPAPIQITGWGFGSTSGMKAMDYRATDRFVVPPEHHRYNVEKIFYTSSFMHFSATAEQLQEECLPLPALTNGYVTFGYGNNPFKLNEPLIDCWAKILNQLPDSRLHLKFTYIDHPVCQEYYRQLFGARGVAAERLTFSGKTDGKAHRAFFGQVDIVLDPFPYNGGASTMDALWMARPVVTLAGGTRSGVSIMNVLGHPEWVAQDVAEYVSIAVGLAQNIDQLAALPTTLRQEILDSPLCDRPLFVQEVEAGYRQMWREWCQSASQTLLQQARRLHHQGDFSQAEDQYRQILQADPQQPEALHGLGLIAYHFGHLDAAVDLVQQAVNQQPCEPTYHLNLGNIWSDLGQWQLAQTAYEQALSLKPDYLAARFNLGQLWLQQGQIPSAQNCFTQVLTQQPDFIPAQQALAALSQGA